MVHPFGVLADRARADEGAALNQLPDLLRDSGDRLDVGDDGAGRAVRLDPHPAGDLARQPLDVADHMRTRAGEADVRGVDAKLLHEMEDFELLVDRGRRYRRRLQPVAGASSSRSTRASAPQVLTRRSSRR